MSKIVKIYYTIYISLRVIIKKCSKIGMKAYYKKCEVEILIMIACINPLQLG